MHVIAQIWWLVGMIAVLQKLIRAQLYHMLVQWWSRLQDSFNPYQHLDVPEFNGNIGVDSNDLYRNVEIYVGSLGSISSAGTVSMNRSNCSRRVEFSLPSSHTVDDTFNGATFWWTHNVQPLPCERRSFTLKMAKVDRRLLLEYVDHIANRAEEFYTRNRDRILYTNSGDGRRYSAWSCGIAFQHPSTFDTLALDPAMRTRILRDLDRFSEAREFYARVGRPWKREYLLHGPPGTGKSSLIAAIANYMKYDVYDLELTKVHDNTELRALLLQTTNKSVIVIEDIDRSLILRGAHNSKPPPDENGSRLTLSGLLNFTDGLWSCCGEERIVIYTTNRKEMLDASLLRCGRMDMHILLSHCSFPAFKSLALNHLLLRDHHLFSAVEQRMTKPGAEMTPADITEILIRHMQEPVETLNAVISALDAKLEDEQIPSPSVVSEAETEGMGSGLVVAVP